MNLTSAFNFELPALSLINTGNGISFLEKLSRGQKLLSNGEEPQEVNNILPIGNKTAYTLRLKNGNLVVAGESVSFYTLDQGWKMIKDISEEDLILNKVTISENLDGNKVINYKQIFKTNAMPIKVPAYMTKEFAMWLGIYTALGKTNHSTGKVSITTSSVELGDFFSQLTKQIFKLSTITSHDKRANRGSEYYIVSKNVSRFLDNWVGTSPKFRKVPTFILEGSTQEQLAYLSGMSVKSVLVDKKNYLQFYKGSSKIIADFTAMVLRNSGYIVYQHQIEQKNIESIYYIVKILGKHPKALEFTSPLVEVTEAISGLNFNVLIDLAPFWDKIEVKSYSPNYSTYLKLKKSQKKICTWQVARKLGVDLSAVNYYYVKVDSITKKDNQRMVSLKTLYPHGLSLSNIVMSGTY